MGKSKNLADLGSHDVIDTHSTGMTVTGTVTADSLGIGADVPDSLQTLQDDSSTLGPLLTFKNQYRSGSTTADYMGGLAFSSWRDISPTKSYVAGIYALNEYFPGTSGNLVFKTGTNGGTDPYNAGTERMRIDASGNVLVGQTTANAAAVGASIRSDGEVVATCSGAASGSFNRLGDGATVDVKKDGTVIGSLASDVMNFLVVGKDETALGFVHDAIDSGNPRVIPRRVGSNAASNNLLDLGDAGSKFRDIHLGGRVKYHNHNVNTELQRTYKQFSTVTTSIANSWTHATASDIVFTPKRSDTTISIFADIKTGQAWSNPSGVNHGQVEWRIKVVNTSGTFTGPEYSDWARVDNFSGVFEKVNTGKSEYHMSDSIQNGSALTISIEFRGTRTAGTGLSNAGINVWGGVSVYTVHEVLE